MRDRFAILDRGGGLRRGAELSDELIKETSDCIGAARRSNPLRFKALASGTFRDGVSQPCLSSSAQLLAKCFTRGVFPKFVIEFHLM